MFNLSRDYQKAFELIKNGDRLVCLLDCDGCRDVAIARTDKFGELTIGARGIGYAHFFKDQVETGELFLTHCDRLNIEFYLPISEEMLVVSADRFEEIATEVVISSLTPIDSLIKAIERNCNRN